MTENNTGSDHGEDCGFEYLAIAKDIPGAIDETVEYVTTTLGGDKKSIDGMAVAVSFPIVNLPVRLALPPRLHVPCILVPLTKAALDSMEPEKLAVGDVEIMLRDNTKTTARYFASLATYLASAWK
jgi:hypothetical protein